MFLVLRWIVYKPKTSKGVICLGQQKSQIPKIQIFAYGNFTVHYVIISSPLSSTIIFFQTVQDLQRRNADILIQRKAIPITQPTASIQSNLDHRRNHRWECWVNRKLIIWKIKWNRKVLTSSRYRISIFFYQKWSRISGWKNRTVMENTLKI